MMSKLKGNRSYFRSNPESEAAQLLVDLAAKPSKIVIAVTHLLLTQLIALTSSSLH
jgi:hypothetical protein